MAIDIFVGELLLLLPFLSYVTNIHCSALVDTDEHQLIIQNKPSFDDRYNAIMRSLEMLSRSDGAGNSC